jgi:hypothetical protein
MKTAPVALPTIALAASLCFASAVLADDDDYPSWRPISTNAVSITGPIVLQPSKLHVTGGDFPLTLAGMAASFKPDQGPIPARIYAVSKPVNPPLLNGNKLCGADPATWIVAVPVPPDGLEIDVFTSAEKPTSVKSPGQCGTFSYKR